MLFAQLHMPKAKTTPMPSVWTATKIASETVRRRAIGSSCARRARTASQIVVPLFIPPVTGSAPGVRAWLTSSRGRLSIGCGGEDSGLATSSRQCVDQRGGGPTALKKADVDALRSEPAVEAAYQSGGWREAAKMLYVEESRGARLLRAARKGPHLHMQARR
jgi:hypothetical protein